jgi:ABC-type Fe3+/spermidine/putrescine transport system ATPase subunit
MGEGNRALAVRPLGAEMPFSIQVTNVVKQFDGQRVLDDVTISVRTGEFVSILGPSGCGKSTLLRIIAGLEEPSDGAVEIGGKDVTSLPVWKRRIGFVFQHFSLWPHLSVLRNITMGLELRGIGKAERSARAAAALRMVQLESFADRMPGQLSGGQQQRVAIARAIVLEPTVLLLDEPLSALDKNLRQDMQVELKSLQRKLNLTTVFVTHDQEEAMSLSDRIVVMKGGVVEQVDTPEAIYNRPATAYVARFVGETTFFEGVVEERDSKPLLRTAANVAVPLSEDARAAVGRPGKAFVRPEWITLSDGVADSSSLPVGTIERVMFFGATKDYLVKLGEATIRVTTAGEYQRFKVGDRVGLCFAARLLPAG